MSRVMEITTPLGDDVLLFQSLTATEELGRLFEYNISVLSTKNDIDPDKILGKNVTVKLEVPGGDPRCFDGYVRRFSLIGSHGRYHQYQIVACPWLWLLTRTSDCRIFQDKKVPDIIQQIFDKYPGAKVDKTKLTGKYRTWEYCVQYRETDFNFVSRLMEQEGIYYYFKHTDGKHELVLADACSAHTPFKGYESVPFLAIDRGTHLEREYVSEWHYSRDLQPGAYVIDDFDFEKPSVELQVKTKLKRGHAEAEHEYYDYPGEYVTSGEGENYVRTRLEELQAQHELAQGTTNARGMCVGHLFKLTGQPRQDQNKEYLVVSANYHLDYNEYEATGSSGAAYTCGFSVMASKECFRTQRATPKPIVQGPQTAIVVGPKGDEIYTDKYGRVKVKFHWDRLSKGDENSSCWVRVSHPWAGKNWGMVAIPRIGQEVIVDFLEGDPDSPIITGRVYNAESMPPYALPANMTQTGMLSRSSSGGSGANANELRFEDKKGSEQVYLHAEKNQDISVENDETHSVGHDRTKTIDRDETTLVKHDRTETVDNNETITIHGQRTEVVDKDETITIHMNRTETVDKEENITIHGGRTEQVDKEEKITISGGRTENVSNEESITIGGGRTEKVAKDESITIGGERTERVSKNENITISGGRTEKVSQDESVTIGQGRTVSVSKDDALSVGKNLSIDAGDSITFTTGSASISMNKDGTIIIKGKNITIDDGGKTNVKTCGNIVMKASKILQN